MAELRPATSPVALKDNELSSSLATDDGKAMFDVEAAGGVTCGLLSADDDPREWVEGGLGGELFRRFVDWLGPRRALLRMLPACAVYVRLSGGRRLFRNRPKTPPLAPPFEDAIDSFVGDAFASTRAVVKAR